MFPALICYRFPC